MSLNDILRRHRIQSLPGAREARTPRDLWLEMGRTQEHALEQGNFATVEHLNRERNRLWYRYILPDTAYRNLPNYIKEQYPR